MIYRGTVNSVIIRPAELFKEAVRHNSTAIILAHNHPTGNPEPSPEDIVFTQTAFRNAKLLEIDLLDHIIIGQDSWVSLKDRELGFVDD